MRSVPTFVLLLAGLTLASTNRNFEAADPPAAADAKKQYAAEIRPLLQKYCLGCHSTKMRKGSLDLERFASSDDIRKDTKPWQGMIEQLEAGEMPPKERAQP